MKKGKKIMSILIMPTSDGYDKEEEDDDEEEESCGCGKRMKKGKCSKCDKED